MISKILDSGWIRSKKTLKGSSAATGAAVEALDAEMRLGRVLIADGVVKAFRAVGEVASLPSFNEYLIPSPGVSRGWELTR